MSMKEKFWMFWLLALMVLGMLTSCKTKYVAVPEWHGVVVNKHDTLVTRDSIYVKDSFYVEKSGDTIATYRTRYIYIDRWRDKIVYRDSIKVDSIRVPFPVERELTFWQKTWMNLGKIGFTGLLGLIGVIGVVFLVRKIIKKYRYE